MPAPLTVVIPTLNAETSLPDTGEALISGVTSGLIAGLIVSDGGSTDATVEIATELGAKIVTGPPGRGGQIARGVEAARTDWVLILHADTQLSPDWGDATLTHMEYHPDIAGYFHLRFRAEGVVPRLVETGANWRSKWLGLPFGDQGLLISRATLAAVGGVPDPPLLEDVALAKRLKGRLRPLGAQARTSAARYQRDGWIRRVLSNFWILIRYKFGVSPADLARKY